MKKTIANPRVLLSGFILLLLSSAAWSASLVNCNGTACIISIYSNASPTTFIDHSLSLNMPVDGSGNPTSFPDTNVTLIYDGSSSTITCNGTRVSLGVSAYTELQNYVTCSMNSEKDSVVLALELNGQEVYSQSFEACPGNGIDITLADTSVANQACVSDSATYSQACKWEEQNVPPSSLSDRAIPLNQWVVFTKTTISSLTLGYNDNNETPPYQATDYICSADLDGNGTLGDGEVQACTITPEGPLCPIGSLPCTSTTTAPDCSAGTWDSTLKTCVVSGTPCPSPGTYNSGTNMCETTPTSCPAGASVNASGYCSYYSCPNSSFTFTYTPSTGSGSCSADISNTYNCSELTTTTGSCPSPRVKLACVEHTGSLLGGDLECVRWYCGVNKCPGGTVHFHITLSDETCPLERNNCWGLATCASGFTLTSTGYCQSNSTVCPSGYTYSSGVCNASPQCPSGSVPSGSICTATPTCPANAPSDCTCAYGGQYNQSSGNCEMTATCSVTGEHVLSSPNCPSGAGQLNIQRDKCELEYTCSSGGYYELASNNCVSETPVCSESGVWNPTLSHCELPPVCSSSGTYSTANHRCQVALTSCVNYDGDANSNCVTNTSGNCPSDWGSSSLQACSGGAPINSTLVGRHSFLFRCYSTWHGGLAAYSCPTNYTLEGSSCASAVCYRTPTCAGDYQLNGDVCVRSHSCPVNYVPDSTGTRCIATPQCLVEGYSANTTLNLCDADPVCKSGATYMPDQDMCDTYTGSTLVDGECQMSPKCPGSGTYSSDTHSCETEPQCAEPGVFSSVQNVCIGLTNLCPSGSWDTTTSRCQTSLSCPNALGTYNPSTGRCEYLDPVITHYCYTTSSKTTFLCLGCSIGSSGNTSASTACATPPAGATQVGIKRTCDGLTCTTNTYYSWTTTQDCESPYTVDGAYCVTNDFSCPASYTQDGTYCVFSPSCPSGYSPSQTLNACISTPVCESGYTFSVDTCVSNAACVSGYTLDSALDLCISSPKCKAGFTLTPPDLCSSPASCSTPTYEYDASSGLCVRTPPDICPAGSYSCMQTGGTWSCNPNPCTQYSEAEENTDTTEGENDPPEQPFENDGSCNGTIYLFNGNDTRCRQRSIYTGFTTCCFMGSEDNCEKDIWLGLSQCNGEERDLACGRHKGRCHRVGSYCSRRILGVCSQRKDTYCCFSSKLGRIIQEQGRPQLKSFHASAPFGDAESPICRGLTPAEFQMLDFNKVDLSEYYGDIKTKTSADVQNTIQDKANDFYNRFKNQTPTK